jgi:hypothetical protein
MTPDGFTAGMAIAPFPPSARTGTPTTDRERHRDGSTRDRATWNADRTIRCDDRPAEGGVAYRQA